MNRVVITGMGAVAPNGNTLAEYWENTKNGVSGLNYITRFDPTDFDAKIAAEVKDYHVEDYIPKKEAKRMDLYSQYAIGAAAQAMADSGLQMEREDRSRVGVIVSAGIGGLGTIEEQVIRLTEKGPKRVGPLFIPMAIGNMAAGLIAIQYGLHGTCSSVVTACASSTHSIGDAFRAIKHGYADVMLAGGAEASVTRIGISGFSALTALSESDDLSRASIPFDKERNGFVLGEGAGILVLEELERAKRRGARIYAEIVGYGSSCDAYHMTAPCPDGRGAAEAFELALAEGQVPKNEVSYINAHGTSTPPNDVSETNAIKKVFGDQAYHLLISSTKSMTGHLLGGAGAIEAIAAVMALVDDFAPPTINYRVPDPDCDLNYVPNQGIARSMQ